MLLVYKYQPRTSGRVIHTSKETNSIVLPKGKYRNQPEGLIFVYENYHSKFHLNAVKQDQPACNCRPCTNWISHEQRVMCTDVTHVKRQVQDVQFKQLKYEILLFACAGIPRIGW